MRQAVYDQKMEEIARRKDRGDSITSIDAIKKAKKGPWNHFTSGRPTGYSQPNWSPEDMPFAKHNSSDDHAWWMDDLERRRKEIRERSTLLERQASMSGPDRASPVMDNRTYTADRNNAWYDDHVKPAMEAELQTAELKYAQDAANTQRMGHYVNDLEIWVAQNPEYLEQKVLLDNMRKNLAAANRMLKMQWQALMQFRGDYQRAQNPRIARRQSGSSTTGSQGEQQAQPQTGPTAWRNAAYRRSALEKLKVDLAKPLPEEVAQMEARRVEARQAKVKQHAFGLNRLTIVDEEAIVDDSD